MGVFLQYTLPGPMRKTFDRILLSVLILLAASRLPAQDLREARFVQRAQAGFADIFNMDYDKAKQTFTLLAGDYPSHPAPPLYLACIVWLEEMLRRQDIALNRFIAPAYFTGKTGHVMSPAERSAFFSYLQKSQDLSKAILQRKRDDMDAKYFLATAYGLRSSFAITIDHSLRESFTNGNRAYSSLKKLTEEKPDYYDAHLTVGIYEYIVGNIPWYLKWMVYVIGARGSKEDGLEHLKLASEKGQYVRNEAQLVCMVLYVREHRFAEALEIARSLNSRFPRSFLFAINIAQIQRMAGRKDQALAMLIQVEKQIMAKEPNFDKLPLQSYRYDMAVELMAMGQLDAAEERFNKVIDDPQAAIEKKAFSHLRLGQILEWKHRPKEAVKEYQTVLSFEDFDGSHTRARQLLKKLN
jgi:tetratricopeptide (TPR) repeat protein